MKLLVEIGNSRIKWALADDAGLKGAPVSARHDDRSWPQQLPHTPVAAVWYATVAAAGSQRPLLEWAFSRGLTAPQRVRSTAQAAGVTNAYAKPDRLGVDRLLACVAAHHRYPGQSVLVADVGTALTIDYVAGDGRHAGGLISPGVATMRDAIRADTQVRAADLAPGARMLGRSTDAAVGQGTLHAAVALLEHARASQAPARLLLTGGEAPLLAPHLDGGWEIAPALVLEGLDRVSREGAQTGAS